MRFEGAPIAVRYLPGLTAHRGKLLSASDAGQPVFAGSFLRKREIVLDSTLATNGNERARILVHELFHFVWVRLGNSDRRAWEAVLEAELRGRARGELGWSSERRKRALPKGLRRDYVCESFCDTAAWIYGQVKEHEEYTLAATWRRKRRAWFADRIDGRAMVRI